MRLLQPIGEWHQAPWGPDRSRRVRLMHRVADVLHALLAPALLERPR